MNLIYRMSDFRDCLFDYVNVMTTASGVKKTGDLFTKVVETINFATNDRYFPSAVTHLSTIKSYIGFCETSGLVQAVSGKFKIENIDRDRLEESLKNIFEIKNANTILVAALAKRPPNRVELLNVLREKIIEQHGMVVTDEKLSQIVISITPGNSLYWIALSTLNVASFSANLTALGKWQLIDLAQIAKTLGETKVFAFIATTTISLSAVTIGCAVVGKGLMTINCFIETVDLYNKEGIEDKEHSKMLAQKYREFVTIGLDFLSTSLPAAGLLVSPGYVLALGFCSKTAGFVSLFCKPVK